MHELRSVMIEIVQAAGVIALEHWRAGVRADIKKDVGDLLTAADIAVNDYIVETLSRRFPEDGIYSEELPHIINPEAPRRWVLDPIDGTRNFAIGFPLWCIMLALTEHGRPIAGTIHAPHVNRIYTAVKGRGAELNGVPIRVNEVTSMHRAFGDFTVDVHGIEFERHVRALERFLRAGGMQKVANTGLAICYLAEGKLDVYCHNHAYDHDFLPMIAIAEEAGATVTNGAGDPWRLGDRSLVVANSSLHPQIVQFLR